MFYDTVVLVAVATVTKLQSRLVFDGNDIVTDCTVHPERYLKGFDPGDSSHPGDITFVVSGGVIRFPNGTVAEIRTGQWESLRVGEHYLLMLQSYDKPDEYVPADTYRLAVWKACIIKSPERVRWKL